MAVLQEYKCPACGGALEFNSELQKMKCPYCDSEFDMAALASLDDDLGKKEDMSWNTDTGSQWQSGEADGVAVYVCKSCGGEIVGDSNTAATSCPFCGNPVVIKGNFSGELRPDCLIPFKLDKKAAINAFKKHLTGKKLLPKVFRNENHIEEVKGIYVPVWLFDADADANIKYSATRSRSWSDSEYDYTETSYYSVWRGGSIGFAGIPADGSTKIPDELMESLEPYFTGDAVDFQTAYLAGYLADKYDVSAEDSVNRTNERVKNSTAQAFAASVEGFTTVTPESTSIRLHNGQVRYALYPVWILNTKWKNKKYTFAMNGQTGKFVGDLPLDKGAYYRWFAAIALISTAAIFILMRLIFML
ncbi:MAG: hypothetical protein ACI4XJ_01000 [Eubacteriales bacterium]